MARPAPAYLAPMTITQEIAEVDARISSPRVTGAHLEAGAVSVETDCEACRPRRQVFNRTALKRIKSPTSSTAARAPACAGMVSFVPNIAGTPLCTKASASIDRNAWIFDALRVDTHDAQGGIMKDGRLLDCATGSAERTELYGWRRQTARQHA